MQFSPWSWNTGPAPYSQEYEAPLKGAGGSLEVFSTSLHVLSGPGEGITMSPEASFGECFGNTDGSWLLVGQSLYSWNQTLIPMANSHSHSFPAKLWRVSGVSLNSEVFTVGPACTSWLILQCEAEVVYHL